MGATKKNGARRIISRTCVAKRDATNPTPHAADLAEGPSVNLHHIPDRISAHTSLGLVYVRVAPTCYVSASGGVKVKGRSREKKGDISGLVPVCS